MLWPHKFLGERTGRSRHRVALLTRKIILQVEVKVMKHSPLVSCSPDDTGDVMWRDATFNDLDTTVTIRPGSA